MTQVCLSVLTVAILFSFGLTGICQASPTPTKPTQAPTQETTSTTTIRPVAAERSSNVENVSKKPRCLTSLFGGLFGEDTYEPMLPDYNGSPYLPGGMQGGILPSPSTGFGGGGIFGSQYTPGLGQAPPAYGQGFGMESQLYSQAQINSQLGGIPGSGIPQSSGYPRNVGFGTGLTYLPPPPSLFFR